MHEFLMYSAQLFMPIYAGVFMGSFAHMLKCLKKEEPLSGSALIASISFALMMWTISASLWER